MTEIQAIPIHHEVCTCGHCRCDHYGLAREASCMRCDCQRYTWPGDGADLPSDHIRGMPFPLPKKGG